MKQSKDPFEAAFEESPPESPTETEADLIHNHSQSHSHNQNPIPSPSVLPLTPGPPQKASAVVKNKDKDKDDEEEVEEDNMDVELSKLPSTGDPHKMAKMQFVTHFASLQFKFVAFYLIYQFPPFFLFQGNFVAIQRRADE